MTEPIKVMNSIKNSNFHFATDNIDKDIIN
jgi:hypothetical protein